MNLAYWIIICHRETYELRMLCYMFLNINIRMKKSDGLYNVWTVWESGFIAKTSSKSNQLLGKLPKYNHAFAQVVKTTFFTSKTVYRLQILCSFGSYPFVTIISCLHLVTNRGKIQVCPQIQIQLHLWTSRILTHLSSRLFPTWESTRYFNSRCCERALI